MYCVHQHWDPLKVCIVGKPYPPEFYSFIPDLKVREVMERIARETEEDFQKVISLLESFGVKILRPNIQGSWKDYMFDGRLARPPISPRDYSAMIGHEFHFSKQHESDKTWDEVIDHVRRQGNRMILGGNVNTAMVSRIGKDLYFGTEGGRCEDILDPRKFLKMFPRYRCHVIDTQGHADGTFCPIKPGLIVSLEEIKTYEKTFPGWEIVYLEGEGFKKILPFIRIKNKTYGKWWVPGEENNEEFTNFVNQWVDHWLGYVEETVFDVNILVIDEKNIVVNNYNEKAFEAFHRHGVTPHIINFRHRFFWDGGVHCITSDLDREGTQKDYFPFRNT